MHMRFVPAAMAGLLACAALPAAAAAQADPFGAVAPFRSADGKPPFVLIADRAWADGEIKIQPREVTGTPANLPRSSRELPAASFVYDAGKGPVTLVIDYFAFLPEMSADGEGVVEIGIECPETPNGCAIPIDKSVLGFRTAVMARHEALTASGKRPLAAGRESHSYSFPPSAKVNVRVSLLEPKNFEPKELRVRLIYGDYDRSALKGQTTKTGLAWKIGAGALLLGAAVLWRLRRS